MNTTANPVIAPTTVAIERAYPFTIAGVTALVSKFRGLGFTTPERYEEGRLALRTCREARGGIELRRKELKADSLEYGRRVDAVAKQLTEIIAAVEDPLKADKQAIDDEKARLKAEAAAEQRRLERAAIEAEIGAKFEAERVERELAAAVEAEQRRIRRAAIEADQERLAAERARLDAERAAHEAERAEFSKAKAAAEQEQRVKELAERRLAEERQRELDRLEFERQQQVRREALRPDVERVHMWADSMLAALMHMPSVETDAAKLFVTTAAERLRHQFKAIREWQP